MKVSEEEIYFANDTPFDGNFHFEKQFTIPLLKLTLRVRTKTVQNKFFFLPFVLVSCDCWNK